MLYVSGMRGKISVMTSVVLMLNLCMWILKLKMPKTREYDRNKLEQAIRDVQNKIESYRSAERKYGIPKSTIEFKIKHPEHKDTFGPSPILNEEEEGILVKWVKDTARKGFPKKANDLKSSVQKFLNDNPRKNPFKNNRPGNGWVKAFLKRHPDISERTSESVSSSSACIAEKDIRHWFSEINDYIKEKGLQNVIADPSRLFNGDESGFQICPATGKVFAQRGSKNVYTIDRGSSKENITVMFTFSADGHICVPMVIYPYQRIPEKISKSINSHWGIGRSDNGWMTTETFYEYIANVFHPYLVANNVVFPVILFLDGHKSHLNYSLSLLCNELQIEVFALYPNATRILQPCDVAVFRPLKEAWRRTVRDWEEEHPGEVLNKITFAPLLEKAIQSSVKPETLVNGFKACGLCPFNPDAIDYLKCLGGVESDNSQKDSPTPDATMTYNTFVSIVGQERVQQFTKLNDEFPNDVLDNDFIALFKIWKHYNQMKMKNSSNRKKEENRINVIQDITLVSSQVPLNNIELTTTEKVQCDVLVNYPQSPPRNDSVPQAKKNETLAYPIPNSTVKDLEASAITKNDQIHYELNEPTPSTSRNEIESKAFGTFLATPGTPKRKGKRNIERFPFAITSRQYQEMFEKKRALKEKEEEEKKERKRKREEKLASKKEGADKKNVEGKIKRVKLLNKNKENVKRCCICHNSIKTEEIQCDECKNYFHTLCVPKKHKQHISDEWDEDEIFLCHVCYIEDDGDSGMSKESEDDLDPEIDELFDMYQNYQKYN